MGSVRAKQWLLQVGRANLMDDVDESMISAEMGFFQLDSLLPRHRRNGGGTRRH